MIYTPLLVDEAGNPVLCRIRHSTCLGVKACSQADIQSLENDYNHTHATRQDVQRKLAQERDPDNKRLLAQRQRPLSLSKCKQLSDTSSVAIKPPTRATAESSTTSSMAEMGNLLSCEHYSSRTRNHWVDFNIQDGSLHLDTLQLFLPVTRKRLYKLSALLGKRALGHWRSVRTLPTILLNVTTAVRSTILATDPYTDLAAAVDHREHEDGPLVRHQMCRIDCHVKFRAWIPVNRSECPYILITSEGVHKHPIPLPEKRPKRQSSAPQCLHRLGQKRALPAWHRLERRATLLAPISPPDRLYISSGVQHLKRLQDEQLPRHLHYIRVMLDIKNDSLPAHEEDEPPLLPERRKAQYLQSDIGFKRIVGYDEFEISAMDRDANTSVVFCRVYLTRHTAAAHQRIFEEIDKIVEFDDNLSKTSKGSFSTGVRTNTVAKPKASPSFLWFSPLKMASGLGLYLVDRAAALPPGQMDLHESWRTLRSLGPYEHLRRIYRLCKVHNYRNIQTCSVSDPLMEGEAGADWVRDKVTSKFAFPGICWEKSFIPFPVWQAGEPNTNLAEAVHSDVNRGGRPLPLLGGLLRGQDYDAMQHETLLAIRAVRYSTLIQPGRPGHEYFENLKRKGLQQAKKVQASMKAVSEHNINLHRAHAGLAASLQNLEKAERAAANPVLPQYLAEYQRCSSQLVRP
ncbi:hypothetical protein B0H14DRAFT_2622839 [Mycena olivaceomarginata]|nr:hypothetical protein B0H14DRAFT_2622839 [Mycena olivaceomarginata]